MLSKALHIAFKWELGKQIERKWVFFDWFKLEFSSSMDKKKDNESLHETSEFYIDNIKVHLRRY